MKTKIDDNGFIVFRDDEAFQFIDIYSVTWAEKGTIHLQMVIKNAETQDALTKTQQWLGEKYLRPTFGNYHCDYCDIVKGIDNIVYEWHNDYEEGRVNLGILLYFSDTDKDVCIINHTEKFEHKVSKPNFAFPRIVGSFHYYVDYS